MTFFSKNAIFDQKKGACGKPPAEENGLFPENAIFCSCITLILSSYLMLDHAASTPTTLGQANN